MKVWRSASINLKKIRSTSTDSLLRNSEEPAHSKFNPDLSIRWLTTCKRLSWQKDQSARKTYETTITNTLQGLALTKMATHPRSCRRQFLLRIRTIHNTLQKQEAVLWRIRQCTFSNRKGRLSALIRAPKTSNIWQTKNSKKTSWPKQRAKVIEPIWTVVPWALERLTQMR